MFKLSSKLTAEIDALAANIPNGALLAATDPAAFVATVRTRLTRLETAVQEALDLLDQLPSGIETDADPNDPAPADATAFVGGLIYQALKRGQDA